MTYSKIWASYCDRCKQEFGHLQKTRAMALWRKHLIHNLDLPELRLREINARYESLLTKQNEEPY